MWKIFLNQSTEAAKTAFITVGDAIALLIGLLIIIAIGWLIARLIRSLIVSALKTVKLDSASESTGINNFLSKGGLKQTPSELIGSLSYWLCLIVTAAVAVDFLGLASISSLLNNLILYIPHIILSIFILLLGAFLSKFLVAIVQTAAANAGLLRAKLLSKIVETIVIIFTIAIALDQLKIGSEIIGFVVKAIIISIAAAIAIAFGLGCKEIAEKSLSDWLERLQEKKR